ncbi:MAG: hypothetical protein IKE28_12685 [Solobacterium sp.]|nr:hypothetical protein [Solobacterium sp.]
MAEIIKVKNASYILYEELLLKRENLRKEGKQFYVSYLQMFGELMTESFQKKIECIRKKKMIAFCQRCLNQGKDINSIELNRFIQAEMKSYEEDLKQMAESVKAAAKAKTLSSDAIWRIKEIYYGLARKIHPDMHPELEDDSTLQDYWNQIVIAYQHNQLDELEELEVMVNAYLEKCHANTEELVIIDVENKIKRIEQEVEQILSKKPYTYRFILEDKKKQEEQQRALQKEIEEYTQYSLELDDVLKSFPIKEMFA